MDTGLLPARGCCEWSCGGQECANLLEIPCWDLWIYTQRWDGRDATLLFTACEGLVLCSELRALGLLSELKNPWVDQRLFYPGAAKLAPQFMCDELPVANSIRENKNMAASPREVAHLLRIGKSRVKNTPKGGTRKSRNRPKSVNLSWAVFTLRKVRGQGARGCWDSDSTWRAVAFYYRFSKVALRCGSPSWVNLCPMKPPRVWGIQVTYFFFSVNATLGRTVEFVFWQSPSLLYLLLDVCKNPIAVCFCWIEWAWEYSGFPRQKGPSLTTVHCQT